MNYKLMILVNLDLDMSNYELPKIRLNIVDRNILMDQFQPLSVYYKNSNIVINIENWQYGTGNRYKAKNGLLLYKVEKKAGESAEQIYSLGGITKKELGVYKIEKILLSGNSIYYTNSINMVIQVEIGNLKSLKDLSTVNSSKGSIVITGSKKERYYPIYNILQSSKSTNEEDQKPDIQDETEVDGYDYPPPNNNNADQPDPEVSNSASKSNPGSKSSTDPDN